MKIISLFDTSISSSNLGDQIIMDAVKSHLTEMFRDSLFIPIQTHDVISKNSYRYIRNSDLKFVGGTNLLSSNMNSYSQWKINLFDSIFIQDITLMGVGWWQYQNPPNAYSRMLYKRVLSNKNMHSVRDSFTEQQLRAAGISNVINTACPTMWRLTDDHCKDIPKAKQKAVVVTFTDYNQDNVNDKKLYDLLSKEYEAIYFWTQGPADYEYMQSIGGSKVKYIPPSLQALDHILATLDCDYIGTRLHAGIRSLQHKRRSLILAVDNRAKEISKDTELPVVDRKDIAGIQEWITRSEGTRIRLPLEQIKAWKDQFFSESKAAAASQFVSSI
ncbi:polysaccharide pyruvyl transferase family protein [Paenibacillus sedimenti]|uniref:Polysaccharide pyruvyl transferase family protein n=1 Tax=Paenibacillus sedimenti TaxID=2770274 RepID=A0A926QIR5_9BACL|nr:polysaccharide pyruvyl transferase family protein [Paenibacillus sedimenti]MBD0379779.1 polysaccharide pyruvyl transferase family protein [Paenibacillus sedimenti]